VEEGRLVGGSTGLERKLIDMANAITGKGFTEESAGMFKEALDSLSQPLAEQLLTIGDAYADTAARGNFNVDDIYMGQYDRARIDQLAGVDYNAIVQQ
jgi:hypothetical protein